MNRRDFIAGAVGGFIVGAGVGYSIGKGRSTPAPAESQAGAANTQSPPASAIIGDLSERMPAAS